MTRRDYAAIAEVLARTLDPEDCAVVVAELIPIFKADNSRFSADRFATACGAPARWGY